MKIVLLVLAAGSLAAATPEEEIRAVLQRQAQDWSRGDLRAFMGGYEDSAQTAFIGTSVVKGFQLVLERYKEKYPTGEKMGRLQFSEIEVRMLGAGHAVVLGRFHLARTVAGGGDARGIFTLVVKRTGDGWRIIHDHTSSS